MPSTWTPPKAATTGVPASVQPRDYIATFITETCQPKNCELTDGIPGKVRRNSSGPCKLAPEYNLPMENRQQCRSKADAAESTPSACRPTTENLAEGKRTELKQILHNESELKKIHCAKPFTADCGLVVVYRFALGCGGYFLRCSLSACWQFPNELSESCYVSRDRSLVFLSSAILEAEFGCSV